MKLNKLSQLESQKLEKLIKNLESKGGAKSLCKGLISVINDGTISFETFYLLSKRCNTGGRYKAAVPVSEAISNLLFKQILPRPSDSKFTAIEICMI